VEYATVKTEELPTVILEVICISCRRFPFDFQKEFDML
jgi:hypothetical protein